MRIEHFVFLSWFRASPEGHEQDGETLSRVVARRATASGDPAMAFEPCLVTRGDPYRLLPNCRLRLSLPAQSSERVRRVRCTKRTGRKRPARNKSSANTELLDQVLVARFIGATQIIEELAALAHHLEQSTTRVVVLDVGLEMLGEIVDALGQDRHLDFWRTGISGLFGIGLDYFGLAAGGHRHRSSFLTHGSAHQAGEVKHALGDDFAT